MALTIPITTQQISAHAGPPNPDYELIIDQEHEANQLQHPTAQLSEPNPLYTVCGIINAVIGLILFGIFIWYFNVDDHNKTVFYTLGGFTLLFNLIGGIFLAKSRKQY